MKITRFTSQTTEGIEIVDADLSNLLQSGEGAVWVDITGPTDEDAQLMREVFKFHPLAIEDTRNQQQRPKAEEFTDHLFLILNPIVDDGSEKELFRELFVFAGRNYLVTVHPGQEPVAEQVRKHLALTQAAPAVSISVSYLLYVLMDVIIDGYFPVLEHIEEEIEALSGRILTQPGQEMLDRLFQLKHTVGKVGRVIRPQQDIINVLMTHSLVFTTQDNQYRLRDISDHLFQITDMINTHRDTLAHLVNLYMSAVSNQLNRVVSRLTVFAIIIGAFTVISGFYGMNFAQTWPPFSAPWGVPLIFGLMVLVAGILFIVFRWRGWL